jgi:hypothetical protein
VNTYRTNNIRDYVNVDDNHFSACGFLESAMKRDVSNSVIKCLICCGLEEGNERGSLFVMHQDSSYVGFDSILRTAPTRPIGDGLR